MDSVPVVQGFQPNSSKNPRSGLVRVQARGFSYFRRRIPATEFSQRGSCDKRKSIASLWKEGGGKYLTGL
jgi:hypothetical protein